MTDESARTRLELSDIAQQVSEGRLRRRVLFDRLKGLGIGFGAAFVLGLAGAQAAQAPEATVALKSTNPALNAVVQGGPQAPAVGEGVPLQQTAYYRYYHRYYMRHYMRHYGRY